MYKASALFYKDIASPSRSVTAKVELLNGSTLEIKETYLPTDKLQSVQVEKIPAMGIFFGYAICQKATVTIIDKDNEVEANKGDKLKVYMGNNYGLIGNPIFTVDTVSRDTVKKTVTITAFDTLYEASKHKQNELVVNYPITITEYAETIADFLGLSVNWLGIVTELPYIVYDGDSMPNLSGTETLRSLLDSIAEATGTFCYINYDNELCFRQLNNYDLTDSESYIEKKDYFSLTLGEPKTLKEIISVTDLGDNVSAKSGEGASQAIKNNPFIVNREDIAEILHNLLPCVEGLVFYPYNIKWRGNPAFEIGDLITIQVNSGEYINIYYLGETLTFDGGLKAVSEWKEAEQKRENSAPVTIGEKINETVARVDKVNRQIELLASETEINSTKIASLELSTDSIRASVETLEQVKEETSDVIYELSKKVEAAMTEEDVHIAITQELANGVDSVETTTGFTFNEEGLKVSKTGSEMETTITEDGMKVYRSGEEVLTANSDGVKAKDLHAETYLIIGKNSRFEDYGTNRTGCFWIGG